MVERSLFFVMLVVLAGMTCACGRTRELANAAEILALNKNEQGTFSLQTRSLHDDMVFQNGNLISKNVQLLAGAELFNAAMGKEAFAHSSFDELASSLKEDLGGESIELNVSIDHGVMHAESLESLIALSALVHLDDIMHFGRRHVSDSTRALTTPLSVAVHGQILMSSAFALPLTMDDNAIYAGPVDAIFLLPHSNQSQLPLSLNEGVLAHELHHRIFFKEVWSNSRYKKLWSLFQSRYNKFTNRLDYRSRQLLNALDEGLADLFAVAYTGIPNYLNVSLSSNSSIKTKQQRDLNGIFATTATYDELSASKRPDHLFYCSARSKNFANLDFNVYCLGTVIAKAIYEAAEQDLTQLQNIALPSIFESLTRIAQSLNNTSTFDLDIFFNELVMRTKSRESQFAKRMCEQLSLRFSSLVNARRIPACVD